MPFKYSCFISYRASQKELSRTFIEELKIALENHIDPWLKKDVFVDYERLKGGDFYNKALAQALCESVCMILVFTPEYFSPENTYCAREYKAMEKLEQMRFELLGHQIDKSRGFIIPIVFRGPDYLPSEIKQERHYYDFSQYSLKVPKIINNPDYIPDLEAIALQVFALSKCFDAVDEKQLISCDEFKLPTKREIQKWLTTVENSPSPFPGRRR